MIFEIAGGLILAGLAWVAFLVLVEVLSPTDKWPR